jgi:hypothetical protein
MTDHKSNTQVYYCCSTNSTTFTMCCNVAVTDRETRCPQCRAHVELDLRLRHKQAYKNQGQHLKF